MANLDPFNALIAKPEKPLAHAASGPLAGERLAVKDIYDIAGMVTGCGNPQILAESPVARKSAPVVEKLLAAGAEFIGKAQTDEVAFSMMARIRITPIRSIRRPLIASLAAPHPVRLRQSRESLPISRSARTRAAPSARLQAFAG